MRSEGAKFKPRSYQKAGQNHSQPVAAVTAIVMCSFAATIIVPAPVVGSVSSCPCRKLCTWRTGANRVMLVADDLAAQIVLWCAHWAVAVQRPA